MVIKGAAGLIMGRNILLAGLAVALAVMGALAVYMYVQNVSLSLELERALGEVKRLEGEKAALAGRVDELEAALRDRESRIAELEGRLGDALRTVELQRARIADLDARVRNLTAQLESSKEMIRTLRDTVDLLEGQLDERRRELDELESRYSALRREYDALVSRYGELERAVNYPTEYARDALREVGRLGIEAPRVGDSHVFAAAYIYSGALAPDDLEVVTVDYLYTYETVMVEVEPRLDVIIYMYLDGDFRVVARGLGRVEYAPRDNGTYYIVVYNGGGRTVDYSAYVTYYAELRWDELLTGLLTSRLARDAFRVVALYNYWLFYVRPDYVGAQDAERTYAVSLAELYRDAGYTVGMAAIGDIGSNTPDVIGVIPVVVVEGGVPNFVENAIYELLDELPDRYVTPYKIITWVEGGKLYVLWDTYSVALMDSEGREEFVPFNVFEVVTG